MYAPDSHRRGRLFDDGPAVGARNQKRGHQGNHFSRKLRLCIETQEKLSARTQPELLRYRLIMTLLLLAGTDVEQSALCSALSWHETSETVANPKVGKEANRLHAIPDG